MNNEKLLYIQQEFDYHFQGHVCKGCIKVSINNSEKSADAKFT